MTCAALGNPICSSPVESPPVSPSTVSPVVLPAPAPVVPVSPPTEPTLSPPTDPPVAPPLSSPTEPPVTTVSPTMQPTLDTLCGINNISLVAGESTTVPPCIDNVDRVTVTLFPINGSLTVNENGSVVYSPNPDFQGEDRFATESCDVDGNCFAMTVVVQVAKPEDPESGGGGSSGALVALSALAVIPIGIIGYLFYRKQRSGSGPHGKHAATEINAPASDFDQSGGQPNPPTHEVASRLPQPPLQQSGRQSGGGYMPRNKDQAQSVLPPSSEARTVTASMDSNSGVRSSAHARASQDPPGGDSLAAATVQAVPMPVNTASDGYLPAVKDQCREAMPGRQSDDPPLADAIVIDASDVEGGGGKS